MTIPTIFPQTYAGMNLGFGLTLSRNCSSRYLFTIFRCFFASFLVDVCILLCFILFRELFVIEALVEFEALFGEDSGSEKRRLES